MVCLCIFIVADCFIYYYICSIDMRSIFILIILIISPKIIIMPHNRKCFILRFENTIFMLFNIIVKLNNITVVAKQLSNPICFYLNFF